MGKLEGKGRGTDNWTKTPPSSLPQVHSFQMGELVFQGVSGYLLLHKETLQRRSF